jgi:hypothetical protein
LGDVPLPSYSLVAPIFAHSIAKVLVHISGEYLIRSWSAIPRNRTRYWTISGNIKQHCTTDVLAPQAVLGTITMYYMVFEVPTSIKYLQVTSSTGYSMRIQQEMQKVHFVLNAWA